MSSNSDSNLSFVLNEIRSVSFRERPTPRIATPHDVLIRVDYTGICGSDVHFWNHGRLGHFVVKDPLVLGHESSGTIVSVGDQVKTLKVGDRVSIEPGYPCRRCTACLGGTYNLCPQMRFAATPPYDGTLTGFWVAPEDFCHKLPDHVSLQDGALIEPLAVAVHIMRLAAVSPGQAVVVMGAGPVGLLCAAVAKAFGASTICSVDVVPAKLEFARDFASTHTYIQQAAISAEENAAAIRALIEYRQGADVVIDATGAEACIQTGLHLVRMGGVYIQGGMGKSDVKLPIMALCMKEVTARGSFRYSSGDYRLAIKFVASGMVDVNKLISKTFAFHEAEQAFKEVSQGNTIKVLISGPNKR